MEGGFGSEAGAVRMTDYRAIALGGIALLSAGIGIGWQFFGYPRGFDAGKAEAKIEFDALWQSSVNISKSREQCKGEVVKQNAEVDRQKEENRRILIDDRAATQAAIAKAESAATRAAETSIRTQKQLIEAGDELRKIQDACVNAGVPTAYFDVLNSALARADAGRNARGEVPGTDADH